MSLQRPSFLPLVLCLLWPLHSAWSGEAQTLFTVGEATDATSGEMLYRELHHCTPDLLNCTVEYRDAADELIARKTLDYTVRLHAPLVDMNDFRSGKEYRLSVQQEPEIVVDAGFDNFVRQRWSDLQDNKSVRFSLQLLSLDRPVQMRAQLLGEACSPQHLCVLVEVDSWLLGLLADPIVLRYSRSDRRLLYFSGISNIKSVAGDSQSVEIRYNYAAASLPRASTAFLPVTSVLP